MIVARSPRPTEATPSLDLDFINRHLEEKEGVHVTERDLVHCQAVFDGVKDIEPRVLFVSPVCLYLFFSTPFKKSVYEAPLLQLKILSADATKDRCVIKFHFDRSRTESPLVSLNLQAVTIGNNQQARTTSFPGATQGKDLHFSIVVADLKELTLTISTILTRHSRLARVHPDLFHVQLDMPQNKREFSKLASLASPVASTEFVREVFLGMYRSAGMMEKRKTVADFLARSVTSGETVIDLDVFQCMCTGFDAQLDLSALGQYLLLDKHFTGITATDVSIGDQALVFVLQAFYGNTTMKSLTLKNTGFSELCCGLFSRILIARAEQSSSVNAKTRKNSNPNNNVCGLTTLEFREEPLDLGALAPAFGALPLLTTLVIARITQKMQRRIRRLGTAGFDQLFSALPATLTHLDLSHNFFTPRDATSLSSYLSHTATSLKVLILRDCSGLDSPPSPFLAAESGASLVQQMPSSLTKSLTLTTPITPLHSLTHNPSLPQTLTHLDLSFTDLSGMANNTNYNNTVNNTHNNHDLTNALTSLLQHTTALRCLVLDGCGISPQRLATSVIAPIVDNPSLKHGVCLSLRDLGLRHDGWRTIARMFERYDSAETTQRKFGSIVELHLDRNELGVAGICGVCSTLANYPPLESLSLDQNLLSGEILSTEENLVKTGSARALLDALSQLLCRTSPPFLHTFSMRGHPPPNNQQNSGCLGPLACQHVIECVAGGSHVQNLELCNNNIGEQGLQSALRAIMQRKDPLKRLLVAPDKSLSFAAWQLLLQCVDRAGNKTVVVTNSGLEDALQHSLQFTTTKKQQDLISTVAAQIRTKIATSRESSSPFMHRKLPPITPREDFRFLKSIAFDLLYSPASNAPSTPGTDNSSVGQRQTHKRNLSSGGVQTTNTQITSRLAQVSNHSRYTDLSELSDSSTENSHEMHSHHRHHRHHHNRGSSGGVDGNGRSGNGGNGLGEVGGGVGVGGSDGNGIGLVSKRNTLSPELLVDGDANGEPRGLILRGRCASWDGPVKVVEIGEFFGQDRQQVLNLVKTHSEQTLKPNQPNTTPLIFRGKTTNYIELLQAGGLGVSPRHRSLSAGDIEDLMSDVAPSPAIPQRFLNPHVPNRPRSKNYRDAIPIDPDDPLASQFDDENPHHNSGSFRNNNNKGRSSNHSNNNNNDGMRGARQLSKSEEDDGYDPLLELPPEVYVHARDMASPMQQRKQHKGPQPLFGGNSSNTENESGTPVPPKRGVMFAAENITTTTAKQQGNNAYPQLHFTNNGGSASNDNNNNNASQMAVVNQNGRLSNDGSLAPNMPLTSPVMFSPSSTVVSVMPPRMEMGSWEDEHASGVIGAQSLLEPREEWTWRIAQKTGTIRKTGRQTAPSLSETADPRKKKMSLVALFDSLSHSKEACVPMAGTTTTTTTTTGTPQQSQRHIQLSHHHNNNTASSSLKNTTTINTLSTSSSLAAVVGTFAGGAGGGLDAADYAARSEAQADHMRLLLRVCNKADTPVSDDDRRALTDVLFSLTASQQADYQARARALLMPYIPSSKFRKKSAMGGVPDVTLSKYSVGFHAGTELQPLAEVQYETVTIVSRTQGKVTYEVECQPESKWPEFKFTVYPKSGVLKKGKPETISISFMAQQKVDLKDLIIININGVHRLLISVKADAEVPVFGVDPYSLDLVSMNGVVLPRILDHMRSYLTNHGGLKLPGIFHRAPDSVLCYAIKQQINRTHTISTRATPESLLCIAHLIKVFFTELPQALLNPLPLGTLVLGDPELVSTTFTEHLSTQAMSLFVWVLDLMTDVITHTDWNHATMKTLVEEFAPCLHTTEHHEKVKAMLFQQLAHSVKITATSHRTASINQMTNHATLKARVGKLIPSQSFTSSAGGTNDDQNLPSGWKLFYTKTPRKRPFYHNQKLQRTQWHRPTSDGNIQLPVGWTVHRTKTPQQRMFFHNKEKGMTQWSMPTS